MPVSEIPAVGVWVFNRLRAVGVTMPIFIDYQPEAQPGRAIVYTTVPGDDLQGQGARRIWSREIVTVWVQDQVNAYYPLRDDAKLIDDALHGKSGAAGLDGLTVHSCVRERPYRGQVVYKGVEYRQLGGTYKVLIGP